MKNYNLWLFYSERYVCILSRVLKIHICSGNCKPYSLPNWFNAYNLNALHTQFASAARISLSDCTVLILLYSIYTHEQRNVLACECLAACVHCLLSTRHTIPAYFLLARKRSARSGSGGARERLAVAPKSATHGSCNVTFCSSLCDLFAVALSGLPANPSCKYQLTFQHTQKTNRKNVIACVLRLLYICFLEMTNNAPVAPQIRLEKNRMRVNE